jgi:Phospholipase A2
MEVHMTKPMKEAKPPKRNPGVLTISAPYLGEISLPVLSEVAKSGSPDTRVKPRQLRLPVYGNYCGLGHGDPTGNTPPIDAVDAVCREHDRCYALLGDFDSRCDQAFIESMPGAIASTPSPAGKNAGFLSLLYFSLVERNLALGETLFERNNLERREG